MTEPLKQNISKDCRNASVVKKERYDNEGDENKERGNWSSNLDFILASLGAAVGLGNVWRFPYLCYKNGGGAFLIPYTIMLFVAGLPLFFMEFAFGQYSSEGMVTCWRALPLLRGMGIGQIIIRIYGLMSYIAVITYCIYYFFASFTSVLPWASCHHGWNTVLCSQLVEDCLVSGGIIISNGTCLPLLNMTDTELDMYNVTRKDVDFNTSIGFDTSAYTDPLKDQRTTPSEEYWKHHVLQESDSMNDTGGLVWQLTLCLAFSWLVTFLCSIKGIKSIGKVVYFTAIFPYVMLVVLFIRGVTLPGAMDGIKFYIIPRWELLANTQVWIDAAVQIFYSLCVANGILQTMASYNKFHSNCYRDAMIVAITNCLTSIFCGFVIFSVVGFMAYETGKPVDSVVSQGFGLAFIAYPEAVARMPASPLWSALFFLTLVTLGLDGMFAGLEVFVTTLGDIFPGLIRKRKPLVTFLICLTFMFFGLTIVTRAGAYWMSLLDQYIANFHKLVFALAETGGLCWIYGIRRFKNDIRTMIGSKWVDHWTFWYWTASWCVITPAAMIVILGTTFSNWKDPEYNGAYPSWAVAIGWCMMLSSLIVIPIDWLVQIFTSKEDSYFERIKLLLAIQPKWGPALQKHRYEAAEVHRQHGTTMGGVVELKNENNMLHGYNGEQKYSPLEKKDEAQTNV